MTSFSQDNIDDTKVKFHGRIQLALQAWCDWRAEEGNTVPYKKTVEKAETGYRDCTDFQVFHLEIFDCLA